MLTAKKLTEIRESVIREMTRRAIKEQALNLSQGMPDFQPPVPLIKAMRDAINSGEHQYTVTYGNQSLREKIAQKLAQYNKVTVNPEDEVTITCG
ncbi:MAG: aminotransferase class I/II-fold pyridoxal phosphate-dependent enzyme, partial [Candidatus Heimdallarchaeaceae archaeon]